MIEPQPTPWGFPDPSLADEYGLVAIGADLEPGTLLSAYRQGFFPMPVDERSMGWWSPDPRGVLEIDAFRLSRSLRRSMRDFEVSFDTAFDEVVAACADPDREHGWISRPIRLAYGRLHRLGWAHSVEVRRDGELVGGLYGVAIGALFAGESMFHRASDASKVALAALVDLLRGIDHALIDVQWTTDHLASLGVADMGRTTYLRRLESAIASAGPTWPSPDGP